MVHCSLAAVISSVEMYTKCWIPWQRDAIQASNFYHVHCCNRLYLCRCIIVMLVLLLLLMLVVTDLLDSAVDVADIVGDVVSVVVAVCVGAVDHVFCLLLQMINHYQK